MPSAIDIRGQGPRVGINYNPATRVGIGTTPPAQGSLPIDIYAGMVIKPLSDDDAGLVIEVTDATYAAGTHGNYGTFAIAVIDKHTSETILGNAIRFYITANGDIQGQGWQHLAVGQADATFRGGALPTQCLWIQPAINIHHIVSTAAAAGTGYHFMSSTNGGTGLVQINSAGQILMALAAVGAPALSFIGDTNTGIYSRAADIVNVAAGGVNGLEVDGVKTIVASGQSVQVQIGNSFGVPAVVLGNASDTSFYRSATSELSIFGKTIVLSQAAADIQFKLQQKASQTGDAFQVLSSAAAVVAKMDSAGRLLTNAGSATNPAHANIAETGTGMYFTAGNVGFAINGVLKSYQGATDFNLISGVGITMAAANIATDTTTGTKIATGGTQKLGFFGTTPAIRPTGVAVTAAGIHAALVTLGLITA